MFFTYVLECSDGSLYTGWTNDLEKRVEAHNDGKGAKYTRSRGPVKLIGHWQFDTKSEALKYEAAVKRLNRKQKLDLLGKL